MDIRDLTLLNKERKKLLIYIFLFALDIIANFFVMIMGHPIVLVITIPAFLVLGVIIVRSLEKVEKALLVYVLSQFPDWKEAEKTNRKDNKLRQIFIDKKIFFAVLPLYRRKSDAHISDVFSSYSDGSVSKDIAKIGYSEYEERTKKDSNGHETTSSVCTYSFEAAMVAVKNSKDVKSITYFQTNNYPRKTKKEIIKENSQLELPKIEINTAAEYNIDVYTDSQDVAEKLATKELFIALQTIKQQLNLYYVKAVFFDDYIIFLLRDKDIQNERGVFPLFIRTPFFKSIDYPLLDKATSNFKALTDLADKAADFTKNI